MSHKTASFIKSHSAAGKMGKDHTGQISLSLAVHGTPQVPFVKAPEGCLLHRWFQDDSWTSILTDACLTSKNYS